MATFVFTVKSSSREFRRVRDIPDGADPYLHAVLDTLGEILRVEPEVLDSSEGYIGHVISQLKIDSGQTRFTLPGYNRKKDLVFNLWFYDVGHHSNDDQVHPNFGFACNNSWFWLLVDYYIPDDGVKSRLSGLDNDALIDLLCRVYAEQQRLPFRG